MADRQESIYTKKLRNMEDCPACGSGAFKRDEGEMDVHGFEFEMSYSCGGRVKSTDTGLIVAEGCSRSLELKLAEIERQVDCEGAK